MLKFIYSKYINFVNITYKKDCHNKLYNSLYDETIPLLLNFEDTINDEKIFLIENTTNTTKLKNIFILS